jgi:arylsulfatase A-like enzyme
MNRRDFLKLTTLLPASFFLPRTNFLGPETSPNILILIFDSWSAANTSLYGYPRKTTPNIDKFAEKAIVYHNHYASGHYTYPSTASLLTGVLPWTHQGYWANPGEMILDKFNTSNIFSQFSSHHRFGYTHNSLANSLLNGMSQDIDQFVQRDKLSIPNQQWFGSLFRQDADISLVSWAKNLENIENGYANSLFLSRLYLLYRQKRAAQYAELFPRGLPKLTIKDDFLLESAIDWTVENIQNSETPYLGYVHLLPPHSPYNTRAEFVDAFSKDSFSPIEKPRHPFAWSTFPYEKEVEDRRKYDEYLLYVDSEFNRLMEHLSARGLLENTIVILTSDHGEMFERGIPEHLIPSFHQPLMHIPLLIFLPNQEERIDIHSLTTTVDLLPTLLDLTDKPSPEGMEGEVLPPFNSNNPDLRTIYSVDFRRSLKFSPPTDGTIMLRKGSSKLSFFFGTQNYYSRLDNNTLFELYNIDEDPEELNNLFNRSEQLTIDLLGEMKAKLGEKNLINGNLEKYLSEG